MTSEVMHLGCCYLFPTLGVGLLDFSVSNYSSLRLPPGVPNPTDYHETPWSAQSQQTTVRLPGVPNPTDYREIPWNAQLRRLP